MKNNDTHLIHRTLDGDDSAFAELVESGRTVMTLHYFGEMSCTEIGAFMGVSANTVKSRLRRAQQRLMKEETMIRTSAVLSVSFSSDDNTIEVEVRTGPCCCGSTESDLGNMRSGVLHI